MTPDLKEIADEQDTEQLERKFIMLNFAKGVSTEENDSHAA